MSASFFDFTPSQLSWIREKQLEVDRHLEDVEPPPPNHPLNVSVNYQLFYRWQARLYAEAEDFKIPKWAVPNVKACWDARRNRFGRGV